MLIAPKWLKIRTSNLACMLPGKVPTWRLKIFFEKAAWPGSRDPLTFRALNANSSKIVKDTNFKFGTHTPRHDPWKRFRKWDVAGVTWPLIFWALNANISKMTKGTNFKFGTLAPRESRDMTPENFFEKGAWPGSRDPHKFLDVKC